MERLSGCYQQHRTITSHLHISQTTKLHQYFQQQEPKYIFGTVLTYMWLRNLAFEAFYKHEPLCSMVGITSAERARKLHFELFGAYFFFSTVFNFVTCYTNLFYIAIHIQLSHATSLITILKPRICLSILPITNVLPITS